ncbi:hypothetical protein [Jeotgalibacillus proteolyticus]|uniref:Lipoprotein n=1 Tax=Jeotgalibacillus proteolyticus TaxID=2082395 RepID=A0A2S5GDC2_9BACL|nr:hypothetical protein [Jeotgalibacillus proteolyticus]PPA70911.1 hypothetical protein C4B60_08985 [Jeotgalibacillus proteolyticus]
MKQLKLLSLVFILLLSACSTETEHGSISYSEIKLDEVGEELSSFIEEIDGENGTYLFFEDDRTFYVYLNGGNVALGEEAIYFDDFSIDRDTKKQTCFISYKTVKTEDFSSDSQNFKGLYKVNGDRAFEVIKAIENNKEVSFKSISGK